MNRRAKRDEWSCPCCGKPNDSSYCEKCRAAGCGSQDYRDTSDRCAAEPLPRGWVALGECYERVQLNGGGIHLCRVELLRRADGERSFGRVMEVIS